MRGFLFVCVLAACAAEPDLVDDEVEVDPDAKEDAASELRVRTGDTTVWMNRALTRRERDGDTLFVMRGRASRNVTDGTGFVNDDPYGDFATRTTRTFEITWPVSTARTLVDGVNQFVRLQFTPSSGRPDSLTARAVVRPRFSSFSGSSSIYLTAELTPVVVAGEVVYRAKGRTTSAMSTIAVSVNGKVHPVRKLDGTHFEIDLAPNLAFSIAGVSTTQGPAAQVEILAGLTNNTAASKQARLGVAIKKLALTAGDAYEQFPRPACDDDTRGCLTALDADTLDLASCGEAIVVQSCAGQIGVFVDDVAVQNAISLGTVTTSSSGFRADAIGLVGSGRVEELIGGAEQTIDDRASRLFGRWLLSPAARDIVLSNTIDAAILEAYTHPLDLVSPITPVPGNEASIRNAAADGLLAELAQHDFLSTEFARSYETLVGQFRSRHVDSIREFRETNEIAVQPDRDVVIGRWLDAYTEVSVTRATGEVESVFIEID
jgi:hypothetical protein